LNNILFLKGKLKSILLYLSPAEQHFKDKIEDIPENDTAAIKKAFHDIAFEAFFDSNDLWQYTFASSLIEFAKKTYKRDENLGLQLIKIFYDQLSSARRESKISSDYVKKIKSDFGVQSIKNISAAYEHLPKEFASLVSDVESLRRFWEGIGFYLDIDWEEKTDEYRPAYKRFIGMPYESNNKVTFKTVNNQKYDRKNGERLRFFYDELEKYNTLAMTSMKNGSADGVMRNLSNMLRSFAGMQGFIIPESRETGALETLLDTSDKFESAADGEYFSKKLSYIVRQIIENYKRNPENKTILTSIDGDLAKNYLKTDNYTYFSDRIQKTGFNTLINIIHREASHLYFFSIEHASVISLFQNYKKRLTVKNMSLDKPSDKVLDFLYELSYFNPSRPIVIERDKIRYQFYGNDHSVSMDIDLSENHSIYLYYGDHYDEMKKYSGNVTKVLSEIGFIPVKVEDSEGKAIAFTLSIDSNVNLALQYAEKFKQALGVLPVRADKFEPEESLHQVQQKIESLGIKGLTLEGLIKMIADGQIIRYKDGLKLASDYKNMSVKTMLESLNKSDSPKADLFRNAQLLNLVEYRDMNLKPYAMFGKMIGMSGIMKVKDGYISINATSINGKEKGLRCASVYFTDFDGTRKELDYDRLQTLLRKQGYISKDRILPKPRNKNEINIIIQMHKERVDENNKSANEIKGKGISKDYQGYVHGTASYDINKKDKKGNIIITGEMSPEDASKARDFNAVLSTGKSERSHAVLDLIEKTASSDSVPLVLVNGDYENGKLQVSEYKIGRQIQSGSFPVYDVETESFYIEESDNILMNPVDGSILLFKKIENKTLTDLTKYIESGDIKKIENIIAENKNAERQIYEYIFYYTVEKGEYKAVVDSLAKGSGILREYMQSVSDDYYRLRVQMLQKKLNDLDVKLKTITDVKIKFNLILILERQINTLNKDYHVEDLTEKIKTLKNDAVYDLQRYVEGFNRKLKSVAKNITEQNLKQSFKLINEAEVWNNFWNNSITAGLVEKLKAAINPVIEDIHERNPVKVKKISELKAWDSLKYGSKAVEILNLSEFFNGDKNINVPVEGFAVPYEVLESYLGKKGSVEYKKLYDEFSDAVMNQQNGEAKNIAKKICELIIKNFAWNEELNEFLNNGRKYAVRSSAVGEDGAKYSFAGIAESELNVIADKNQITNAIASVWTSFFSEGSIEYMLRNRVVVRPAVFGEEMVNSVKSGVIFTKNNEGDLIIEADWGLAGITGGKDGDHIIVSYNQLTRKMEVLDYKRVARDESGSKIVIDAEKGGIVKQGINEQELNNRVLSELKEIQKLALGAVKAESNSGYPVDIEFAIDDEGKVSFLQRRPESIFYEESLETYDEFMFKKNSSSLSIFNKFFKNTKTTFYKAYTVFFAPVAEEFLFRALPFGLFFILPVSFPVAFCLGIGFTMFSGFFIFPKLHEVLDNAALKYNPDIAVRSFIDIFPDSVKLTFVFFMFSIPITFLGFPVIAVFTALIIPAAMHIYKNYKAVINRANRIVLSMSDAFVKDDKNNEIDFIDKAISLLPDLIAGLEGIDFESKLEFKEIDEEYQKEFKKYLDAFRNIQNYEDNEKKYSELQSILDSFFEFTKGLNYFISKNMPLQLTVIKAMLPVSVYADINLAKKFFDHTMEIWTKVGASVHVVNILHKISREIYSVDKKNGLELIKELYKERYGREAYKVRIIKAPFEPVNLEAARESLPEQFADMVKSDKDLIEYYREALDIDLEQIVSSTTIDHRQDYVRILDFLPSGVKTELDVTPWREIPIKIYGKSNDSEMQTVVSRFDSFNELLVNNSLALTELNGSHETAVRDAAMFLSKMIDGLKKIHPRHGESAAKALEEINKIISAELTPELIKKQKELKTWRLGEFDGIGEVHTLINAVHQAAIADFTAIRKSGKIGKGRKIIVDYDSDESNYDANKITVHDYSQKDLSAEIISFLSLIVDKGVYESRWEQNNDFIMKDGRIIWSRQLGVHSIDILVDLNEINGGIRLSFNDSGRSDGSALRTSMLAAECSQLGMDITMFDKEIDESYATESGNCGFQAVYSLENKKNLVEQYAEVFHGIYRVATTIRNLDYDLEGSDVDSDRHYYNRNTIPDITIDSFKKIKGATGMPEQFKGTRIAHKWEFRHPEVVDSGHLSKDEKAKIKQKEELEKFYEYFKILPEKRNPSEIVRLYADGKLIIGKKSKKLEHNKKYNPIKQLLNFIIKDRDETFRQAQMLNLIDYVDLNFTTEGYIGNMLAVSGMIRVEDGFISVRGAAERNNGRLRCATTEFVNFYGDRRPLKNSELMVKLQKKGYVLKVQKERSISEKKDVIKALKEKITSDKDCVEVIGTGVSAGLGGFESGIITTDKKEVGGNSIWVVGFATPDDIVQIENAKGLITTSGGILSHANITAREKEKTAVLTSAEFLNDGVRIKYYKTSGKTKEINGFHTQKAEENKIPLEGRVLINGETGAILVFDKIEPSALEILHEAIENDDINAVLEIINTEKEESVKAQKIEYLYYYCAGKVSKNHILSSILYGDNNIKQRVESLDRLQLQDSFTRIKEILKNIKIMQDKDVRMAYNLILNAESILSRSIASESVVTNVIAKKKADLQKLFAEEAKRYVRRGLTLSKKRKMSEIEIKEAAKMINMANVWKNFYDYPGIAETVQKLEDSKNRALKSRMTDRQIKGLELIDASDLLQYGSKTTELAEIYRLFKGKDNIEIPYAIGVGNGIIYEAHSGTEFSELMTAYENAMENFKKDGSDMKRKIEVKQTAKKIRQLIANTDNPGFREEITKMLDGNKRYAVRSSGVGEDGGDYAFAGMGETELNVRTEDVYENIKKTWMSFFDERSVEYMLESKQIIKPAILVQEMVEDVEKSGIAFSRDSSGNLTLEMVWGLCEGAVSGRVMPDNITFRFADNAIEYTRAIGNVKKIVPSREGGVTLEQLTRDEQIERIVDEKMIKEIVTIVSALEKDAGYSVDVEFSIGKNGKIYILQRRPVSTFVNKEHKFVDGIKKQKILIVSGDITQSAEQVVNIAHFLLEDSSIPVYFKGVNASGEITLCIEQKYFDIFDNEIFVQLLQDRINTDPVVRKKLNPYARNVIAEGSIEVSPAFNDFKNKQKVLPENINVKPISAILSAA